MSEAVDVATLLTDLPRLLEARAVKGPLRLNDWTRLCPAMFVWWARQLATEPGEGYTRRVNEERVREVCEAVREGR